MYVTPQTLMNKFTKMILTTKKPFVHQESEYFTSRQEQVLNSQILKQVFQRKKS